MSIAHKIQLASARLVVGFKGRSNLQIDGSLAGRVNYHFVSDTFYSICMPFHIVYLDWHAFGNWVAHKLTFACVASVLWLLLRVVPVYWTYSIAYFDKVLWSSYHIGLGYDRGMCSCSCIGHPSLIYCEFRIVVVLVWSAKSPEVLVIEGASVYDWCPLRYN